MLTTTRFVRLIRPKHAGFTLIEVMITVAVVGILAAVAIPSYDFAIKRARRAEARTALMQMMQMQERYFSVMGTYLAFDRQTILAAAKGSDLARFKWYSADTVATSHYELDGSLNCPSAGSAACSLSLRARQSRAYVAMFKDTQCGDYWLQSDGNRGNGNGGAPISGCW